ncbi:MAG: hypothetical protein F2825_10245, partial [Actinobacteria bacterium]|nr:hypothetical protein [Actinomycetota bacterium]
MPGLLKVVRVRLSRGDPSDPCHPWDACMPLQPPTRRVLGAAACASLVSPLLLLAATPAQAVSPDVVISQVYGGGGNSGATLRSDFIELFNRSSSPVPLAGWTVQYASAAGTTYASTALTGTLAPGAHYLVKEADGANTAATPLPTPDATGTIAMSGSAGKVRVVTPSGEVRDLVAYGSNAAPAEGSPAPGLSNTTAALRAANGCTDTDSNATDFTAGDPAPRNTASAATPCGVVVDPEPEPGTVTPIAEVQGDGATSPFAGDEVTVEGVVVGDYQGAGQFGGFYVQSTTPDTDPLTSDGLRVFVNGTPVAVGDTVRVTGTVSEFASSSALYTGSETQLGASSTVTRTGTAPVPAPTPVTLPFAPTAAGVDGPERVEGTLTTLTNDDLVATDLFTLGRFGEVSLTTGDLLRIPTTAEQDAANNADRITLDDALSGQNLPTLPYTIGGDGVTLPRAGDGPTDPVTGVLTYAFGEYRVQPPVGTTIDFARLAPREPAP